MRTKNSFWMAVWLFIFLTACKGEPKFINHSPPSLTVSSDAFNEGEIIVAMGCDEIQAPSSQIGGLNPSYPIAICAIGYNLGEGSEELRAEIDSQQFFYYTGGLVGNYVRYIIQQNGEFVLLRTEADFRKVVAPIESPDEALSYVLAVRNLSAYYGLHYDPAYEYEVDTVEDTYVTSEAGGYLVHLFHDRVFGCGPHWTSEVDVRVTVEGNVEEAASKPIFRDPNMDELCVD
ncbi:MAG: hypothetical protein ABI904_10530 [Chloroflexota bacterium]